MKQKINKLIAVDCSFTYGGLQQQPAILSHWFVTEKVSKKFSHKQIVTIIVSFLLSINRHLSRDLTRFYLEPWLLIDASTILAVQTVTSTSEHYFFPLIFPHHFNQTIGRTVWPKYSIAIVKLLVLESWTNSDSLSDHYTTQFLRVGHFCKFRLKLLYFSNPLPFDRRLPSFYWTLSIFLQR